MRFFTSGSILSECRLSPRLWNLTGSCNPYDHRCVRDENCMGICGVPKVWDIQGTTFCISRQSIDNRVSDSDRIAYLPSGTPYAYCKK